MQQTGLFLRNRIMAISSSKWYILFLVSLFLLSCSNSKKENKEKVIVQLFDSFNACKGRRDGERMLLLLDSLKRLELKTDNGVLYYADAYAFIGDYDKALQLLKDSLSVSSKPRLLYNEMGGILLAKGDTTEAIIAYKQAIDCNPSYARPYVILANVYRDKNEKELAVNHYIAAVRIFAEYEAYEEMGSYAAEALELDSTNIELEKFLQYYYIKQGDHRSALAIGLDIDEHCVAQKNPKEGYANQVFMAMSLYELEDYKNALSLLYSAAEDEETAREYGYLIYCYASACFRMLGDNDKADDCLKGAKEIDAENAEAYINSLLSK